MLWVMGRLADEEQTDPPAAPAGRVSLPAGPVTAPAAPTVQTAPAAPAAPDGPLRDEVDDLTAAWRRQRPDLDVEPLDVLSRVSRLARHLDIARRSAFAAHGLESWEFDVLSALRRAGPPFQLTPGALLRATLVTSGTMTNRIDRLAESGLVFREPDPRDRRGVLVTLSERGMEVVDAAFTDLLDREQALLASLPADQRRVLAALLRTLLAPFDAADQ
jgi:DNA-binding MarR family transcriptional regulator